MKPEPEIISPPLRRSLPRLALRLAIAVALVWAGLALFHWLQGHLVDLEDAARTRMMTGLVIAAIFAYAVVIAIPFVPGIEIAIALMVMEGAVMAPFVWLATNMGLGLAFLVGRHVPLNWLYGLFSDLRMRRACQILHRIRTEAPEDRLAQLSGRLPRWLVPLVTRYRYVMIGVLLNLPGNVALGGGGGIMMMAGISRLFSLWQLALIVALATAPVPLAVWIMGADVLM